MITVRDIGVDGYRAICSGGMGEVAAVFERSVYLKFTSGWACVGNSEIGSGPLNVPCSTLFPLDWRDIAQTGAPAWVRRGILRLDKTCLIQIVGTPIWCPPGFTRSDRRQVMMALKNIGELLPPVLPHGGLADLLDVRRARPSHVLKVAWPAVGEFEAWVASPDEASKSALDKSVRVLLGLGPGLTPSGDDFLAGAMAALRGFGREDLADEVWRAIETAGIEATTSVSYAHLRSAARGMLGEDLHGLLGAILGGRTSALRQRMEVMNAKPNHSPWDALSGVYICLRALCRGLRPGDRPTWFRAMSNVSIPTPCGAAPAFARRL